MMTATTFQIDLATRMVDDADFFGEVRSVK
jgi:hypothetical protein